MARWIWGLLGLCWLGTAQAAGVLDLALALLTGGTGSAATPQAAPAGRQPVYMDSDYDFMTERCISCHDGSVSGNQVMSHPVGIDYRRIAAQRPNDYHPVSWVETSIPLVDGRVSCISCHQLKRRAGGMQPVALVTGRNTPDVCLSTRLLHRAPDGRSACLACHIK